MRAIGVVILAMALLAGACGDVGTVSPPTTATTADGGVSTLRLWIKADIVTCQGEAEQTCLQVAESEDGPYELFYDQIEGFTHVAGTEYVIDVEVTKIADPPADASSLAYRLVATIRASEGGG